MRSTAVFCIFAAAAMLTAGCATVRSNWRRAVLKNDVPGYEGFLSRYPKGPYADSAKRALERLPFALAAARGTASAYLRYLSEHPDGLYADSARHALDSLGFSSASAQGTAAAYRQYLSEHPFGEYVQEARAQLEKVTRQSDFTEAKSVNTVESYDKYLAAHPEGELAKEARSVIERLRRIQPLTKLIASIEGSGVGRRYCIPDLLPVNAAHGASAAIVSLSDTLHKSSLGGDDETPLFLGDFCATGIGVYIALNLFSPSGQIRSGGMSPQSTIVFPFAHRTVYRFIGRVDMAGVRNVIQDTSGRGRAYLGSTDADPRRTGVILNRLAHYTFIGDIEEPLAFVLLDGVGFVHISGRGVVRTPSGKAIKLGA